MNENTKLVFDQLGKAIERLAEAVERSSLQDRLTVDGTIQRFEFSIELSWKALKKLLIDLGRSPTYPKHVMQLAYTDGLIQNEQIWLAMLEDRNLTSHTYKEKLADEIYNRIKEYLPEIQETYKKLVDKF